MPPTVTMPTITMVALRVAARHPGAMTDSEPTIDETGKLVREDGAFVLRRDRGGRYILELQRVPVDHVEKRVRVQGVLADGSRVIVAGVCAA